MGFVILKAGFRGFLSKPVKRRQLLEAAGSAMAVDSIPPPRKSPESSGHTIPPTPDATPNRKTILLAEDNKINRKVAVKITKPVKRQDLARVLAALWTG